MRPEVRSPAIKSLLARILGNARIRTCLLVPAIGMALVSLAVALIGLSQISHISADAHAIYAKAYLPTKDLGLLREQAWTARWYGTKDLTAVDAVGHQQYRASFAAENVLLAKTAQTFNSRSVTSAQKAAVAQFAVAWQGYQTMLTKDSDMVAAGQVKAAQDFSRTTISPQIAMALGHLDAATALSTAAAGAALTEVDDSQQSARIWVLLTLLAGVALAASLALIVAGGIVSPIRRLQDAAEALGRGDLTVEVRAEGRNELAQMGRALASGVSRMRQTMTALAGSAHTLGMQAEALTGNSGELARDADLTTTVIAEMSTAVDNVSLHVTSVAGGAEEMGASIREISVSAQEASLIAGQAVTDVHRSEEIMARLDTASQEISEIVRAITSIAEQTNLLALNATIEAARAGDAGKGFAVVASEVKDLAQETARATESISERVQAIQLETQSAVQAIAGIANVIGEINSFQASIASAVEQQSATTNGMSAELHNAAEGAALVHGGVDGVVAASAKTRANAEMSNIAAEQMATLAHELENAVSAFSF